MQEILNCELCPRLCHAVRAEGKLGFCGAGDTVKIFRWGPHMGEEPPISGENGSGTVFFSHCTLGCLYCQNYPWSKGGKGELFGTDGLEKIFLELAQERKCHNLNLVTPGPWLPFIAEAAARVRAKGVGIPFVYNTSGYERVEIANRYRELFDIVLTDLRYSTSEVAQLGSSAPNYPEAARSFIEWCRDEVGQLEIGNDGIATRGMIVRILVLPGKESEAIDSLKWLANTCGTDTYISVMSQYTPVYKALETAGWDRKLTESEYARVVDCADELGFENGWIQEFDTPAPEELLGCNMQPGGADKAIGKN